MFGEENEPNDNNWPRGCEPPGGMNRRTGNYLCLFFERGDQHQICGGSSKCSLSIFFGEPAEHECRGKS